MVMKRAARYGLIAAAGVVVLVLILVVALTRTQFGGERAGRLALDQVRGAIHGDLDVERISAGRVLRGVTLHGVTLRGPDGRLFLAADSARLAYRFRTFLRGSFVFDRLILHGPEVVIERLPGQEQWNYERIFPEDTSAAPDTASTRIVLLEDLVVEDGLAIVRMPWEPDGPVEPEDTARLIMEEVPGGLVRTMRFEALNARLPRIVWETPDESTRLVEVGELTTRAFIWETPMHVEAVEGVLTMRDSLLAFEAPTARLPRSELGLRGTVIVGEENLYDIQIDGRDLAFSDLQWLYPGLPEDGGGTMQVRIQTRDDGSILWLARDARIQTGGTEMSGSFGVVTGDSLYFTNVDLDASPLDLDLLQRMLPMDLELEGLLIGTVEVEGPISALDTRGDVRLRTVREGRAAESSVRWAGTVGGRRPYAVTGLSADQTGLDLGQVAQVAPGLRLRGTATGRVRANGSLERGLDVEGDVALDHEGQRSAVRGQGRFAVGGDRSAFDLRFDAEPVGLELLVEQFPGLGRLAGEARGPVMLTGTLEELRVDADLQTPAGDVRVDGTFSLMGPTPRYTARGEVRSFQLHRVARDLPETVVTGRFDIQGAGDRLESLSARGGVEVASARVAGVAVGQSSIHGVAEGGLLRLDTVRIRTEVGDLTATGTFGIVPERSGEVVIRARARGLSRIEAVVFPHPATTTELEVGPEARLAGALDADLVVTGSLDDWSVRGAARARGFRYDRLRLGTASANLAWHPDSARVEADADSVHYGHRRMHDVHAVAHWTPAGGRLVAAARGADAERLDVDGSFQRSGDETAFLLRRLDLATGAGQWGLTHTVRGRLGRGGVRVDSAALVRAPHFARIRVVGSLPWTRAPGSGALPASLRVTLDSVRIGELLRATQTDTTLDGVVGGELTVAGTSLAPRVTGRVKARPFRYGGAVLDSAGAEIRYADRLIRTEFAGWRGAEAILHGAGTIPVDLALTDRRDRLLDDPIAVRVRAERAPAGLVAFLAPGFNGVSGTLSGDLAVVGTTRDPGLEGELRLEEGAAVFEPLNVRYEGVTALARMGTGRRIEIEADLSTGPGTGTLAGAIDVTRLRDPGLDLTLTARQLQAARRRDVTATATGRVRVTGSYARPVISGDVRLLAGELNLDEIWRQYQIVQLDASLLQLFDSTAVPFRPEPENPFLENLVLTSTRITADRDFWLRSRELNVEVSGALDVEIDRRASDLRLTGALQAMGGSYALQLAQGVPGRTFEIRGGTVEFVGTPGLDPGLDIAAGYRLRRAQGDPIDVVARVTGSLKDPRVALSSDSDLPLTESDLASYILFGRSGAELTRAESDMLSSGIGLVRPVGTGILASVAQDALAWTGLVDYVAFTTPEYGMTELRSYWESQGLAGVFHNTQVEVGIDAGRDVSLVVSGRIPTDDSATLEDNALWRQFGARVEWRFRPTWTTELYVEDRFARTPSFGLAEIDNRKVWGLSLFREWGY